MLKAAILGYGGIAQSHRLGYERLEKENAPVRLAALCDIDPSRFENDAARRYACYTDLETMLREEKPDIVDICLPTYLHADYAVKALKHGCHVLIHHLFKCITYFSRRTFFYTSVNTS